MEVKIITFIIALFLFSFFISTCMDIYIWYVLKKRNKGYIREKMDEAINRTTKQA